MSDYVLTITKEQQRKILELARDCRKDVYECVQQFFKKTKSPYSLDDFQSKLEKLLKPKHHLDSLAFEAVRQKELPLIKLYVFMSKISLHYFEKYRNENILTYAVLHNHVSMVKFIIEVGANINLTNHSGFSPLEIALLFERIEIAQILLYKKYKVVLSDAIEVIKFLLDKPQKASKSLLYFAAKINADAFKLVLLVSTVEDFYRQHPYAKNNFLNLLVMRGNRTILKLAVDFGVNLNYRHSSSHLEPIYYAVTKKAKIIPFLVKNGADLHTDESYTHSSWLLDVKNEFDNEDYSEIVKAVKAFEKCGVNIYGKLADDENELYHLCRYANEINSFLIVLESGTDINHVNKDNYTPLKFALEDDLFKRSDKHRPIEFLVSIITRMIQNKEFVSENNIECLKDERVRTFHKKCKEELCRLENKKIKDLVSYYDFLTGDLQKLVTLARNKDIIKQFRFELNSYQSFPTEYPIYFLTLKRSFERAIWRLRKVDRVQKIIKLPPLVVEKICKYLNDKELNEAKYYFTLLQKFILKN